MEQNVLARYLTKLLILLGFSPRHIGFGYVREMILVAMNRDEQKLSNVYPSVAEKHNQPVEAVQTAVRTALKTAQNQSSFSYFETLLGTKFIEQQYALAPREFIGLMREYLTYVWNGCENDLVF